MMVSLTKAIELYLSTLAVEDGRAFMRSLMERDHNWEVHPLHKIVKGKLSTNYIHGCGRAIHSFSCWALREGYLETNVFAPMKLPKLPKTLPEPLTEVEIRLVLDTTLHKSMDPLRDFAIFSLLVLHRSAAFGSDWSQSGRYQLLCG